MIPAPPISTPPDSLCPCTTLFVSCARGQLPCVWDGKHAFYNDMPEGGCAMIVDTLLGAAAAAPIDAIGNVFDKLFTSDDERLQAQAVQAFIVGGEQLV